MTNDMGTPTVSISLHRYVQRLLGERTLIDVSGVDIHAQHRHDLKAATERTDEQDPARRWTACRRSDTGR